MSIRLSTVRTLVFCVFLAFTHAAFAASVTLSPSSLSFGNQVQGVPSTAKKVTLTNGLTKALTITSIGNSLPDYTQSNTCPVSPATLAAGATCTISVTFTPTTLGARSDTLQVNDSASGSPQNLSLNGTGVAAVTATPTSLSYANQVIGKKSSVQTVTVKNNQSGKLTITSIVSTLSDYTTTTTCPLSPSTLAGGATCKISVFFTPAAAGTRSGTLTVADNAAVSPTVSLTGTGVVAASVNPASVTFAGQALGTTSGAQTVTLTNNQSTALKITSLTSNVSDFANTTTCPLSPSTLAAGASCAATLTFSPKATGSRTGTLSFTDNASNSPQTVSLSGTGNPANLVSMAVTPANSSVAAGLTQQFTATGTYSDGSTQNLTAAATWTSSATAIATISSAGLATGNTQGTSSITATSESTSGSVSGATTLTVLPASVVSIAVTPTNPSIALGTAQQMTAVGTYSDGSTLDITATAAWSTADATVATISATGLASSVKMGSAAITATVGALSGSTSVTVTPSALVSIAVTPAIPSIPLGTTQQFAATGTYTDGSTQDVTKTVIWSSSQAALATISNLAGLQGLATSLAIGPTTIAATFGGLSGSTTLTVGAAVLVSIAVSPSSPGIAAGTTQQFTATGSFSDGSTQDLTASVTWTSDAPSVGSITASGLATGNGVGTASITAASGAISASTVLTVTAAQLVSIAVTSPSASVAAGTSQQFTATGTYTDSSIQDLTGVGHWSSSDGIIATISNTPGSQGVASALSPGATTISISAGGVNGWATLNVTAAALVSISLTPQNPTIAPGGVQQFDAIGTYTDGTTQDITTVANWSSSNAGVAVISNSAGSNGLATSAGAGAATITATMGSVSASTTMTVSSASLVSIAILPANASVLLGSTLQLKATGTYSDNSTQDLSASVTWASSDGTIASVSNAAGSQGVATATGVGSANISASSGAISSNVTLIVYQDQLMLVSITPTAPSIVFGGMQQFTATGTYSNGSTLDLTASVTWASSNVTIATVSNVSGSQGLAQSATNGVTTISATLGSIVGTTTLTVTPATLISIAVTPANPSVTAGLTEQFAATGTYSDGSTQNLTNLTMWTSSATTLATIASSGLATSLTAGTSTISASLGIVIGTTTLVITQAPQPVWTQFGPGPRYAHTAVFDPTTKYEIVFGGTQVSSTAVLNDVWVSSSISTSLMFTPLAVTGSLPPARYGHVSTYDSATNRMTVFGGAAGSPASCMNDVWVLTGANGANGPSQWISSAIQGVTPGPRRYHAGGYDPVTNSLIVFGGSDCNGGFLNDVWLLSFANGNGVSTWTKLNPTGSIPPARESSTAIYDSSQNVLTIYAGDANGSSLGDVWTLSNANGTGGTPAWTQLSPGGTAPSVRTGHSAVYDSVNNRMIVYGGFSGAGKTTTGETWVLTGPNGQGTSSWTQVVPKGTVPNEAFQSAVYDAKGNALYIFGGTSSGMKLSASSYLFALSGANGLGSSAVWTLSGPPARYSQSAFYDVVTNTLGVFGGVHAQTNVIFGDFWRESGLVGTTSLNWSRLTTAAGPPSARYGHTGLFDAGSDRLMIFGGALGFPAPCSNDYWILKNANGAGGNPQWTATTTAGTSPAPRYRHASAYDPTSNTLMLFGGSDCQNGYFNEVWVLSNANSVSGTPTWTKLEPTGNAPSARQTSTAVYDPASNVMVVFGGDAGGTPFGDLWFLSNANGLGGPAAWSQMTLSGPAPRARSGHSAAYDSVNNRMIVYGGYDGTKTLSDAWVLLGANGAAQTPSWTMLAPSNPGPARMYHSAVYDAASNELFVYGGVSNAIPWTPTSDLYSLTLANGLP